MKEVNPDTSATEAKVPIPPSGGGDRRLHLLREVLETLLLALVVFALIRLFIQNYRIEGQSMEPSLHRGQFLVVNRLAYRLGDVQRGDIIVFRYPISKERVLIKRVVGLPDDHLEIIRGQVWVNGQPLEEPYFAAPGTYSHPLTVIELDHVFVMGDNRNNSNDSRTWGSLPLRNIVGKAAFCYWPPQFWGPVLLERPFYK